MPRKKKKEPMHLFRLLIGFGFIIIGLNAIIGRLATTNVLNQIINIENLRHANIDKSALIWNSAISILFSCLLIIAGIIILFDKSIDVFFQRQ
ncbi:MAG: hypothetical protein ABR981_03835 [Candidatus Micrarchaeaceae archaeon]|jgi:hypothetical protein